MILEGLDHLECLPAQFFQTTFLPECFGRVVSGQSSSLQGGGVRCIRAGLAERKWLVFKPGDDRETENN